MLNPAVEILKKAIGTIDNIEKKIREELLKLDEETGFDVMSFDINEDDFGGIQFGIEEDLNYLFIISAMDQITYMIVANNDENVILYH